MAFYRHNPEDDIPYFSHIKMFQEIEENDVVYVIDLNTLHITEDIVEELVKETHTEKVFGTLIGPAQYSEDKEYEYTSVSFKFKNKSYYHSLTNVHFGTETSCLNTSNEYIICTTEREANHIIAIIKAKCNIQASQFKSIFHGAGFNYEPKHYKIH